MWPITSALQETLIGPEIQSLFGWLNWLHINVDTDGGCDSK